MADGLGAMKSNAGGPQAAESQPPVDKKLGEPQNNDGSIAGQRGANSFQNLSNLGQFGQLPDLQNIDPSIMSQIQPLLENLNNNPQIQNLLKEIQHNAMPLLPPATKAADKDQSKKEAVTADGQNKAQPEF